MEIHTVNLYLNYKKTRKINSTCFQYERKLFGHITKGYYFQGNDQVNFN